MFCRAETLLSRFPWTAHTLPAPMQERHNRLRHQVDRLAFLAVRVGACLLWGRALGRDPTTCRIEQHCPSCGGPHGRPSFVGEEILDVSWAHSRDLIGVIVGPGRVAIDVESGMNDPPAALTGGRTPEERLQRWMLAECWAKAGYCELSDALDLVASCAYPNPRNGLPDPRELHRHLVTREGAHALILSTHPCSHVAPSEETTDTPSII